MGHFDGPALAKRKVVPTEKADGIPKKKARATKARKTTVLTEEEDNDRLSDEGIEIIETTDKDGNTTSQPVKCTQAADQDEESDEAQLSTCTRQFMMRH